MTEINTVDQSAAPAERHAQEITSYKTTIPIPPEMKNKLLTELGINIPPELNSATIICYSPLDASHNRSIQNLGGQVPPGLPIEPERILEKRQQVEDMITIMSRVLGYPVTAASPQRKNTINEFNRELANVGVNLVIIEAHGGPSMYNGSWTWTIGNRDETGTTSMHDALRNNEITPNSIVIVDACNGGDFDIVTAPTGPRIFYGHGELRQASSFLSINNPRIAQSKSHIQLPYVVPSKQ